MAATGRPAHPSAMKGVCNLLHSLNIKYGVLIPPLDVSLSEFVIEHSAIARKLSQINVYKAPGPDSLSNCILRPYRPYNETLY